MWRIVARNVRTSVGGTNQHPGIDRLLEFLHTTRQYYMDAEQAGAALRAIRDARDHALFWLIYDGGLRCQEALGINLEGIDDYLKRRGEPTAGALFITARRARSSRRANLTADGYARGYNEIELERFSGHQAVRSREVYIAHNREAAKRKARSWERWSEGRR